MTTGTFIWGKTPCGTAGSPIILKGTGGVSIAGTPGLTILPCLRRYVMVEVKRARVIAEESEHPHLDHLGRFTMEPGDEEKTVDREARGVRGRGENRYFVAQHSPDETGNPDSVEEDWRRMEAYGDEWCMLRIRAEAKVVAAGVRQTLTSGGVGGVPSDSPDEHLDQVADEEVANLRDVARALGIENADSFEVERNIRRLHWA